MEKKNRNSEFVYVCVYDSQLSSVEMSNQRMNFDNTLIWKQNLKPLLDGSYFNNIAIIKQYKIIK